MITRLAVDANALIDLMRDDRKNPPHLELAHDVFIPISAVGELFAGAYFSRDVAKNLAVVEEVIGRWKILDPDIETARVYGRLRTTTHPQTASRLNDLWIAALCIQHDLPLLTNDRGFDAVQGLRVLHW